MATMQRWLTDDKVKKSQGIALVTLLVFGALLLSGLTALAEDPPAAAEAEDTAWQTSTDYAPIGDPRAVRVPGSTFKIPWMSFITTLRTNGPNSNSTTNSSIEGLLYEGMIQLHPETEEFIPCLANKWKIDTHEDGKQTFTFHLDERARFADGTPVTANDVYTSWWHQVQEDRKDPMARMSFAENFEEPVVLDERTIQVKTTEVNWRLFLYFGGMPVYPAKEMKIPGDQYLEEYNWKMPVGTGPYKVRYDLMRKGEAFILERREDWWAEKENWAKNTYNFDRVEFIVIRDREMIYEKFKSGELDWYQVGMARRWIEDIPKEKNINAGYIQKRKIYNEQPVGYSGLCFNMRKPPFDEIKVRMAFAHLFNREMLMEKLFFNEYEYTNSIFPGRDWGSGDERPRVEYDPDYAEELLEEAGYEERDDEGYLIDADGKRLEVTLEYANQGWERIWLPVQENYRDAGIKFNLKLIDGSTLMKKISERKFQIHYQGWGAILFPNPETSWRSDLAGQDFNNNIPSFFSPDEVDPLLDQYNRVLDRKGQKAITRKIDTLVCAEYPYAFGWHSNNFRLLFWDKFGYPDNYVTRIGNQIDEQMLLLWWSDPEREATMEAAKGKAGSTIPQRGDIVKPWAKK